MDIDVFIKAYVVEKKTVASEAERSTEFCIDQFQGDLKLWALTHDINHEQLKGLLQLWNSKVPLQSLPQDPRTVLNTPRHVEIKNRYWHFGLRKVLDVLKHIKDDNLPETISLRVNIDGLPISKSSGTEVWPILVDVAEIKYITPCVVGIYCGSGKIT